MSPNRRTRVEFLVRAESVDVPPGWTENIKLRLQKELSLQFGDQVQVVCVLHKLDETTWSAGP